MARKKVEEAGEPKITAEVFERSRGTGSGREVLFLRPETRHRNGDPEPEPDDTPVVRTSPPAFAVQLKQPCPPEADLLNDRDAFRRLIAGILPNVEARARCAGGVETIALWLGSAPTREEADARERSLQQVSLLTGTETVAMLITLRALRAFAQAEFDRMPRRLSEDGSPSSDGPIHLESIRVDLVAPNRIVTRVEGFDDRPWPDVDFTATITDTISLGNRSVRCVEQPSMLRGLLCESTQAVDVDDADVALAAGLGILTIPFGIGFYFLGELFGAGGPDGDDGGSGEDAGAVGCALTRLVQMPIARRGRVVLGASIRIEFGRSSVTPGGVLFGGRLTACQRFPRVSIRGPNSFTIPADRASVPGIYSAETADTFGNLQFRWTATHARVHSPNARTTQITFNLGGQPQNGVTESQISLTVTDGDGALPAVTKTVRIRLTAAPPGGRPRTGRTRQPL